MTEKIRTNALKQPIDNDNDIKEDPDTGLEIEREDPTIKKPFNPEEIRVRTENVTVQLLVSRIEHNEVELEPPFQRSFIWRAERQSRLIESLLLRIPIPVFYVAADENDNWLVVDGVQRISTIYNYVTDQFPLRQLEYLDKFDQKRYSELPRSMQRRIDETQLVVNVIDPRTPEDVMFNIFHRINTGGMTLNGQEIRNALHPGPVRDFLKRLANIQAFLQATDNSIKTNRMADRECVLRFIAFYVDAWEEYNDNDLNGYLNRAMKKTNAMDPEYREVLAKDFEKAMDAAYLIFDREAFRKRYDRDDSRRRPVSKALFDAWSVGLARCAPHEIRRLVVKREHLVNRFISLMNEDSDFDRAISYSTGTPQRVKKRFHAIAELIAKEL
ncbi:MAG: DUF262 domain-containing protein [Candidatus Poribacteria bacterium]|nr:DUF262 domain-containing protein [Candidatus Poribacteria bacterium]